MTPLNYKNNFTKKFLFVAIFLLADNFGNAQIFDSIRSDLHHKPKFFFDLYGYNSAIGDQGATFIGLGGGLGFNKKLFIGMGATWLNSDVIGTTSIVNDSQSYETNTKLKISFLMISTEYIYYKKYPWTLSVIPINFGIGHGHYEYLREPDHLPSSINETDAIIYNPNIYASFNVFKWIGLSSTAGYRFSLYSSSRIRTDLDSPTYSIGIKFFVDVIYDALFPNGIFRKKIEPEIKPLFN